MDTSEVNLEADYCGMGAAHQSGNTGRLCGENIANVSRKLVCNANLGPLPGTIHTSVCSSEENMVTTSGHGWGSSNTDGGLGVASSSYSREKEESSSGYR